MREIDFFVAPTRCFGVSVTFVRLDASNPNPNPNPNPNSNPTPNPNTNPNPNPNQVRLDAFRRAALRGLAVSAGGIGRYREI